MKINKIAVNSRVIADKVKVLETRLARMKGLMFSRKLNNNEALVFVNKEESIKDAGIHMIFVFFKIDVVWLDKNLEIIDIRQEIMPFNPFIKPRHEAKYIIEMSAGKVKETNLHIGERLKFL